MRIRPSTMRQCGAAVMGILALSVLVQGPARGATKMPNTATGASSSKDVEPVIITGKPAPSLAGTQWADSGPSEAVKGKTTIVMTFVTWCPICNQWAPEMIKQLSTAIDDKPVVVLAICTDKGAAEGKAFLQAKGLKAPNVFYGAAPKMNELFGMDPKNLWNFAFIDSAGIVKKNGQAGGYYTNIEPKRYALPNEIDTAKVLGKLEFLEPSMSATIKPLVWQLELGDLSIIQKISQPKNLRGLDKDDQTALKDLSTKFLDTQLEDIKTLMTGEVPGKIDAYERAQQLSAAFKTTPQGKEAGKLAIELGTPAFRKEMLAKKMYTTDLAKGSSNEKVMPKLMLAVAKAYPDTYYGTLAKSRADGTYKEEFKAEEEVLQDGKIAASPKSEKQPESK